MNAPARARSTRAGKPVLHALRRERLLREALEERQAAEKYQRRAAGLEPPSTSVRETWFCWNHETNDGCRDWSGGATCDHCGRARPLIP